MSRPAADASRPPVRVALVGAGTQAGVRLREALSRFGLPGARVDLYGATDDGAVLTEYAGEARLIQAPDVDEIAAHQVVYLCETGELARRVASSAGKSAVLIDLVEALGAASEAPLVDPLINPEAAAEHAGRLAVAHPLAQVLAGLLAAVDRRFRVREALAFVIRPAADFGEDGLDELREQTVRLLNFAEIPTRVFGQQLAFNVLSGLGTAEGNATGARVAREVARLLGWEPTRLGVTLVTAPVFHGHSVLLRVRFDAPVEVEELRAALDAAAGCEEAGGPPQSALDVVAEAAVTVAQPVPDGLGGYWIWAVAGDSGALAADRAVLLADRIVGL